MKQSFSNIVHQSQKIHERRETNEANPKIALVFCLQQQQKEGQPKQSQQSHRVQVTELRIYGV